MFDEIAKFVPMGAIDETTMRRGAAVSGESARRLATWGMGFFAEFVDEPIRRGGGGPQQVLDAAAAFSQVAGGSLEVQFTWLLRRAIEHHTMQYIVTLMEEAIEQAGIAVPRSADPPAIAFLDLSGYTSMTEQLGDDAAADRSLLLARVVQKPVGDRAGDVIKLLGDGVLMHFPDPANAVRAALVLVDLVPEAGLPAARVGIAAGPVVWRDGDTFGRTVNVASRILGVAGPGQVLVTQEAAHSILVIDPVFGGSVRFDDIGTHRFKGVTDPVRLFRVSREAAAGTVEVTVR
jgi:class 3 adenylate cyclase